MEKGTIADWEVKDGDQVKEGQVILILETEKAAEEIPAPTSGRVAIFGKRGEEYECGTVVAAIAETKEEYDAVKKDSSGYTGRGQEVATETETSPPQATVQVDLATAQAASSTRIKISPVARRLVHVHKINITNLKGSGPQGRIVKKDVMSAVGAQQQITALQPITPSRTAAAPAVPALVSVDVVSGKRVRESIPLRGMRKSIADHMQHSSTVSARVSFMSEVDMTELIQLREFYLQKADEFGVRITYTDLFIYIVAKILRAVPIMNSSLVGEEIKLWEDVNIGFAASITRNNNESGLVVPVIRNADQKTLVEIGKQRKELTDKARNGSLSLDDLSGGTFTITNTGTFNPRWHVQTPIINHPEAAILGTSGTVERAVVRDGQIMIRPIMPISLSFDHRIMDGAAVAIFFNRFAESVEDPRLIIA